MLEDISLMRALPNMRVLVPADYMSAKAALKLACEVEGPVYVRMGRQKVAEIFDEVPTLHFGGSTTLREGSDLSIISCGVMVELALQAAEKLSEEGIEAEVIDAYSIVPFDEESLLRTAQKTKKVVSLEEHSIYGGLGSTVAEILSEKYPCKLKRMGMDRIFGTSGNFPELLDHFELDVNSIVRTCKNLF